jgi:hypothetical protein
MRRRNITRPPASPVKSLTPGARRRYADGAASNTKDPPIILDALFLGLFVFSTLPPNHNLPCAQYVIQTCLFVYLLEQSACRETFLKRAQNTGPVQALQNVAKKVSGEDRLKGGCVCVRARITEGFLGI